MRVRSVTSLTLVLTAIGATAAAEEALRSHRFDTAGIDHLRIEHRAGELALAPAEGNQIEVELRIQPQDGHDVDLAGLDVESRVRGEVLTLSFGERHVTSHMLVRVPSLKQLTIDAGAGEVQGTLPPMDASVLLDAGTVDLDVDRSSTGRVDLRARVGDTTIEGAPGAATNRVLLVGSTSSAAGDGLHRVEAKVRAGDVRVGLR